MDTARTSTSGAWQSRAVVIATGDCDTPSRPACAAALPPAIVQVAPRDYRSPDELPDGAVLIVGASSTGVQLAEDARTPRAVRDRRRGHAHASAAPLSRPRHLRGHGPGRHPRRSGRDQSRHRRRAPSAVVAAGRPRRLARHRPCRPAGPGRAPDGAPGAIDGTRVRFRSDLVLTTAASHERLVRTLNRIDAALDRAEGRPGPGAPARSLRSSLRATSTHFISTKRGHRTVIWATGYVRRNPWPKALLMGGARSSTVPSASRRRLASTPWGSKIHAAAALHFISGCGVDAEELARTLPHTSARRRRR